MYFDLKSNTPKTAPNLQELSIRSSGLNGTLPTEIGLLTALTSVELSSNPLLGGTIPSQFGTLSSVSSLFLNDNKLEGSIPSEIFQMKSLSHL